MQRVTTTISPDGPFSLEAAASFGFGARAPGEWHGIMRLAFVVDGFGGHAGVVMREQEAGKLELTIDTDSDPALVEAQVARILSLDHDGAGWAVLGERDDVIGNLQKRYPGMRPVLFHSPYEGAAWSIISMRQGKVQARRVLERLCVAAGHQFELEGEQLAAFPLPSGLLEVDAVQGLAQPRLDRLHALARAAMDGRLDPVRLRDGETEAVLADLTSLPGVGPFTAGLMLVRAAGTVDTLHVADEELRRHTERLSGEVIPDEAALARYAERWRPYRTWASVLVRVDAARVAPPRGRRRPAR